MFSPTVSFQKADIVTILPSCTLDVVFNLSEVSGRKMYIDYEGFDGVGLPEDAPPLNFYKIYANLEKSNLAGGYRDLFRVMCPIHIDTL